MTTHLVVGPPEHGVTRCALDLLTTDALRQAPRVRLADGIGADLVGAVCDTDTTGGLHVHFTDRLFGRTADAAAAALEALAGAVATTVTLHDVPQPSDGETGFPRRAAAYARVVAAARGVIVSSEHESALLDDALARAGTAPRRPRVVVPLAITEGVTAEPPADAPGISPDLVLLGFLYPGKGHAEALEALASLPPEVGLLALGRPSPGHDNLVDDLAARAAVLDRRFAVTGWVPDADLPRQLGAAAVPVAPHAHLSASGSINTWLAAGRRPLVPRSRYAEELERRCPGALWIYDDLATACAQALADPAGTWLAPDVRLAPPLAEAGAAYRDVLAGWHR
ncbi:hypothetical protein GCM10027418_07980 [Mariniluteicoccus endophyticus]